MDNKNTGKCYLLIAFMEWIVCELKLLKIFRVIFLLKGHSVTVQDVSNEPISIIFFSSKRHDWLIQPTDVSCVVTEQSKDHSARVLSDFYNWKDALSYDESVIPNGLVDVHILLTRNDHPTGPGTMFYSSVDRENNEVEGRGPYCILRSNSIPSHLHLPVISPSIVDHLKEFILNHPNLSPENLSYLTRVTSGGYGIDIEKLVFPEFVENLMKRRETGVSLNFAEDVPSTTTELNSDKLVSEKFEILKHKSNQGMR